MKKILLVLKNELVTVLSRPSFWLTALGIPLLGALIFGVIGTINQNAATSETVGQVFTNPVELGPEGYVDPGHVIKQFPTAITAGRYIPYASISEASQALAAEEISAYYVVSADYVRDGKVTYVRPDFSPLASSNGQSSDFTWILQTNLAGGDSMLASLVNGPRKLTDLNLAPPTEPDQQSPLTMWVPYAVSLLFFGLIIGSASLLLSSVSKEKENRIMEVLLTSVKPRELLGGKILGLGIAGLGQTIVWVATSYVLLSLTGRTFKLSSAIHIPVSFIAWGVVFFLLGYAAYASLMAGLGALVPNLREASQATIVILIPMMIPMMLSNTVFAMEPHGAIATILSLFPLSAPVAMMTRIIAGGVPWWQLVFSAVLLALTSWFILRSVARMFRAQALLSGQAFNLKRYFRALAGREV